MRGEADGYVIKREQLAFLKDQREPQLTEEMRRQLRPTVLGRGNPGFEPVYRYMTDDGKASVDFWHKDFPVERLRGVKGGDLVPIEVLMVVETIAGAQPRIIWPPDLINGDIDAELRAAWPKIYP